MLIYANVCGQKSRETGYCHYQNIPYMHVNSALRSHWLICKTSENKVVNIFQVHTWISGSWNRASSLVPTRINGVFGTCWRSSGTHDSSTCTNDFISSIEKQTKNTSLLRYEITLNLEKSSCNTYVDENYAVHCRQHARIPHVYIMNNFTENSNVLKDQYLVMIELNKKNYICFTFISIRNINYVYPNLEILKKKIQMNV